MSTIKETTLHPDGNEGVDLYPKTNINQVQELPQKLLDINNSLSNIINSKLNKPTNPVAESAVTMLADGTVGTKLLSEIGGGGGVKLYKHDITITLSETGATTLVYIVLNDTYNNNYRFKQLLERYNGEYIPATISVEGGQPVPTSLYFDRSTSKIFAYMSGSVVSFTGLDITNMVDNFTEL